jgi:hypothetical protein
VDRSERHSSCFRELAETLVELDPSRRQGIVSERCQDAETHRSAPTLGHSWIVGDPLPPTQDRFTSFAVARDLGPRSRDSRRPFPALDPPRYLSSAVTVGQAENLGAL